MKINDTLQFHTRICISLIQFILPKLIYEIITNCGLFKNIEFKFKKTNKQTQKKIHHHNQSNQSFKMKMKKIKKRGRRKQTKNRYYYNSSENLTIL